MQPERAADAAAPRGLALPHAVRGRRVCLVRLGACHAAGAGPLARVSDPPPRKSLAYG